MLLLLLLFLLLPLLLLLLLLLSLLLLVSENSSFKSFLIFVAIVIIVIIGIRIKDFPEGLASFCQTFHNVLLLSLLGTTMLSLLLLSSDRYYDNHGCIKSKEMCTKCISLRINEASSINTISCSSQTQIDV